CSSDLRSLQYTFCSRTFLDDDIDVMNALITENIVLSAGQSIGKTSGNANRKYKPLPYWNSACSEAIRARNKARNRMNKSKSMDDVLAYKRLKGIAQRTIKAAARECWTKYCDSLDSYSKL